MSLVSVIIPSYNGGKYLPETLDSVLKQTYTDYEIIIVDDGSSDDTKDVVERYRKKFPEKIKYIYQKNAGPASARNNGIRNSSGEFIAFVDCDDVWVSEKLQVQVDYLRKHPQCGFVFSDVFALDKDGRIGKTMMRFKHPESGKIFYSLLKENFVLTLTLVTRRKCIEKVNGFCEDLLSSEDHHCWLKMANFYDGVYINLPLAFYRIRQDGLSSATVSLREKDIRVIDMIIDEFPDRYKNGVSHYKKAKSNLYYEIGFLKYRDNDFAGAVESFCLSLKENMFNFHAWKSFLLIKLIPVDRLKKRNDGIAGDETELFQ